MATGGRRRLQLNPAFASAHGLAEDPGQERQRRIDLIIEQARKTGKVKAANANLISLERLLTWPAVKVNLSLDQSSSASWEVHVPESVTLLDITDNNMDWDDGLGGAFPSLKVLRARQCRITRVGGLDRHANLQVLDLRGNLLSQLNLSLLPITLRDLDASSNQLTCLGETSLSLKNLLQLDVSENQLSSIPVLQAPHLHKIICGNNCLTSLEFLQECSKLTTLDAPNNRISTLPTNLQDCFPALMTINLSNNRISGATLQFPASLIRLVLNDNSLPKLNLKGCPNLVDVLVRSNRLDDVPENISECAFLKTLDLRNNHISDLPYQVGHLQHLQTLHLEGNPLRRLRSAVSNLNDTIAVLTNLQNRAPQTNAASTSPNLTSFLSSNKTISLEDQNVSDIPPELIQELQRVSRVSNQIERIILDGNKLQSVPEALLQMLPNLTILQVQKNLLATIPMFPLPRLQLVTELHLSGNRIQFFDNNLPATLQVLDLSWNKIGTADIHGRMSNLRVLNVSGNRLTSFSWEAPLPSSLEVLKLSDNRLETLNDLPLSLVAHCPRLSVLLLNNNSLPKIPLELGLLKDRLTIIDLKGNPQRFIRYGILEKSSSSVLEYLQDRMTPRQLKEAQDEVEKHSNTNRDDGFLHRELSAKHHHEQSTNDNGQAAEVQTSIESNTESVDTRVTESKAEARVETRHTDLVEAVSPATINRKSEAGTVPGTESSSREKSQGLKELQKSIAALSETLSNDLSLSQAKRHAVKKQLAMERSKLIREERRLKQQSS